MFQLLKGLLLLSRFSASVVSDSVRPHRQQPTRLRRPWDSPGKNTGVDCHFLLQCRTVKSESEVAQSCPTPSDPMDCSPPGSSVHGTLQARVLEWGAIASSFKGLPWTTLEISFCLPWPEAVREGVYFGCLRGYREQKSLVACCTIRESVVPQINTRGRKR